MKLKKYLLQELAMRKKTQIIYQKSTLRLKGTVLASVVLEDGERFDVNIGWKYAQNAGEIPVVPEDRYYKQWYIEFVDKKGMTTMSPKNKGVALELFAALEEIIKKFLDKEKPEVVTFFGMGASKVKLYDLAVKKMANYGGYKYGVERFSNPKAKDQQFKISSDYVLYKNKVKHYENDPALMQGSQRL